MQAICVAIAMRKKRNRKNVRKKGANRSDISRVYKSLVLLRRVYQRDRFAPSSPVYQQLPTPSVVNTDKASCNCAPPFVRLEGVRMTGMSRSIFVTCLGVLTTESLAVIEK